MSAQQEVLPTPESIAKYVKQNVAKAKKSSPMMRMMRHRGGQEIVREDDYKGHHIVVRTTYHIRIDGREVTGHVMLTNDGQVQYHGLPNRSFDSTIQLARSLIDNFPEDFEKPSKGSGSQGDMQMKMEGKRKTSEARGMHMTRKAKRRVKPASRKPKMTAKGSSKSKSSRSAAKPRSK